MSLNKIHNNFNNKSKIVCKYFILGKCIKGKNCPYLHSQIDTSKIECPMYSIGYCKNGPLCQFSHIKKEKFSEEDNEEENESEENKIKSKEENFIDDEDVTSSTPLAEDLINNSEEEKRNTDNKNLKEIGSNKKNINEKKYPIIPIWYLEHYYDKPISMIFSELENQNLPEVKSLQKKYRLKKEFDNDKKMVQSIIRKNNSYNNTLNLNFNNFNMNFELSKNEPNFQKQKQIYSNFNTYPQHISKDQIEYIINKDINIYYYLLKLKKYKKVKKAYESNIIRLPELLYNKYKYINLFFHDITIIIIIYNTEYDEFVGFARLQYPIIDEDNEYENKRLYKIEWLWKNKMSYSEVSHLMNRADHDHFLNEGKNGCPIHKDLGNYICRLMIKRLSKKEVFELINEKQIFKDQMQYNRYLKNLKRYKYDYNDYYYNYNNYQNDNYEYDYYQNNYYTDNVKYEKNDREKSNYLDDEEYYYHKEDIYKEKNDEKIKLKIKRKQKKIHKRSRSRSRSRNKSISRIKYKIRDKSTSKSKSYYSDKIYRKHKKRKDSDEFSTFKHDNKYSKRKIYSHINQEYDI